MAITPCYSWFLCLTESLLLIHFCFFEIFFRFHLLFSLTFKVHYLIVR